ncbi:hypothetical protein [Winogradskya humida]|uniref:Oligosaccharide repeat unit polymerase n=1 Tax=Winogradskya humida TaxID=113566 RepID=A0ABQ3ZXW6_9ACTN|nr:hypothetical protein [Actinoplanes humidus]GIE23428.1 hypothetical protein Ahu01nite_065300 [Actinoplanes humidus]
MTVSVVIGLLLQLLALWLVHVTIRGQWLRHTGAMLLTVAVIYQGVTELMQSLFPGREHSYRYLVRQDAIDNWVLLVSAAILLFAVGYVGSLRLAGRRTGLPHGAPADPAGYLRDLKLRWLLISIVPLMITALTGRGETAQTTTSNGVTQTGYALAGLTEQFYVLLVGICGAALIARYGTRWMLPLFVVQGGLIALAGQRMAVVIACVLSLYGAAVCGVRPTRKQLTSTVLALAFLAMAISSARAAVGRDAFASGGDLTGRILAVAQGVENLPRADGAVLDDVVYRFDGNAFGAIVTESLSRGAETVGLTTVKNDLLLAVPSLLYPTKIDTPLRDRSEEVYLMERYGLPLTVDYLPGLFGTIVSYYGPLGLVLIAVLIGMVWAVVDRWILDRASPLRMILGLGLTLCALSYEKGPAYYPAAMRGVLLFAFLLWVIQQVNNRNGAAARRTATPKPASPVTTR